MQQEKGQVQIIVLGLILIGGLIALNYTGILGGKKASSKSSNKTPVVQTATTTTPDIGPQRSNLYPTGTLPAGTKETLISVATNEAGYCRFSQKAGTAYSSMSGSFSNDKEKTFHSAKITDLDDNKSYELYVRCRDMDDNKNTEDAIIRFTIGFYTGTAGTGVGSPGSSGEDVIPPVISNLYPTGTLPAGTYETQLSVATNEAASCRYSITANTAYSSMTKGFIYDKAKLSHTAGITGLADNKIYEYYVRCIDTKGNKNTSDVVIRFGVGSVDYSAPAAKQDITPPYRHDGYPDEDMPYSTKSTLISLKTDERAICRYDTVSGMNYGQMKVFTNTDALYHSTQVSGFNEGETYKYYVKCSDSQNNINTDDFLISFKVEAPKDVTPPVITVLYPYSDVIYVTTEVQLSIQTNESASCKYDTEQGVAYNSMKKSFTKQAANMHTAKVTGLKDYVYYSFFIRCKDAAGNVNTGDVMISFQFVP